jgi:hypothetical protein
MHVVVAIRKRGTLTFVAAMDGFLKERDANKVVALFISLL